MRKLHLQFLLLFISFIIISRTASSQVVISQVYGGAGCGTVGCSVFKNDFIEILNRSASPVSITGWSVQYASATGSSWQVTALPSFTLQAGQYFLIAESFGTNGVNNLPTPDVTGTIAMSATAAKVALVNTTTALSGTCPVSTTIVDLVGYGTTASCFETLPAAAPSTTTSVIRASNGCTDNNNNNTDFATGTPTPRNKLSSFNPCFAGLSITTTSPLSAGTVGSPYSVTVAASGGTGAGYVFSQPLGTLPPGLSLTGAVLSGTPTTTVGSPFNFSIKVVDNGANQATKVFSLTVNPPPCNPPTHTIAQIQGSGIASPLIGNVETTSGIVTGRRSNGFFMQTPDGSVDADPTTSEGIFVFTSVAPPATAAIGNSVCVTGTITEFIPSTDPSSPSQTEITSPSVTVLSTGNPLPTAIILTSSDTDPAGGLYQLEKFESMRVQVNSMTVVAPTQGNKNEAAATSVSNGFFYGVITGVPRPFREPGVEQPDPLPPGSPATVTRWDANPELIGVGSNSLGGPAIDVATGAILTNVTGPLDFRSRAYTIDIDPASPPVVSNNGLTFTPIPTQTNDELTVASFNIERFYDDINDPNGDAVLTTMAYNNRLNKVSLAIRNVLRTPDILGIIEVEKLTVLQAIANKVNADAVSAGNPNPNYQAYLIEGNDVGGIDVGFLVKTSRVNVVDVTQYGQSTTYTEPSGSTAILNDRPPLVLRATFAKPGCSTFNPITVIVNHLRSLNGVDDIGATGTRVRAKRKAQAEFLANLIQQFQTSDPGVNIISVGDYNAFQFSDGYVDIIGTVKGTPTPASQVVLASEDLVNPDLTNLLDTYTPAQQYSYSFSGSAQAIDQILVNANLLSKVSRFSAARVDADFPEIYRTDANRPERISDHDGLVAYILFTDTTAPIAVCKPASITLVNGAASIIPSDVDGGSNDECGAVTLSVSTSQFDCSNIGANNVTLTVTDAAGNSSTCTAVVTVIGVVPSCTITAIPSNNIYTGGIPTNIYLGYGPQSVTLYVNPIGGAPFTYSWAGSNLSCTNCAAPVFTPTTEGVYSFTVTVTNSYGCTTTCSITVCVLDIRVPGTNGKKVYVCHAPSGNLTNRQTLSLSVNAVNSHLVNHTGDKLGKCGQDPCSPLELMITENTSTLKSNSAIALQVSIAPNPSVTDFTLAITGNNQLPVIIRITDMYGRIISQQINAPGIITKKIGNSLLAGIYFAEVMQGNERKLVKLIKL